MFRWCTEQPEGCIVCIAHSVNDSTQLFHLQQAELWVVVLRNLHWFKSSVVWDSIQFLVVTALGKHYLLRRQADVWGNVVGVSSRKFTEEDWDGSYGTEPNAPSGDSCFVTEILLLPEDRVSLSQSNLIAGLWRPDVLITEYRTMR